MLLWSSFSAMVQVLEEVNLGKFYVSEEARGLSAILTIDLNFQSCKWIEILWTSERLSAALICSTKNTITDGCIHKIHRFTDSQAMIW